MLGLFMILLLHTTPPVQAIQWKTTLGNTATANRAQETKRPVLACERSTAQRSLFAPVSNWPVDDLFAYHTGWSSPRASEPSFSRQPCRILRSLSSTVVSQAWFGAARNIISSALRIARW
ncbi:hypothetical protein F4778DRAFT_418395 [Xylariomycetidae sp. FL2044]|nr:hypothetical protein F4778DRAFT_418395 [Xylariomycetidae sp. FL2044]